METTALSRLCRDFSKAQVEKWGAILSSLGAALTYLLLLVLLYFFVDLVVWQGAIPAFAELTPAKQKEFEKEWAARSDSDRADASNRATASVATAKRDCSDRQYATLDSCRMGSRAGKLASS